MDEDLTDVISLRLKMLSIRGLVFAALFYQNVLCGSKLCSFDDSECLTRGTKRIFQEYINGNLRGASTSDPLHVDLVEGNLPDLKYSLHNSTLSGFRNCVPELVKINTKDNTYLYHVACKHLIMEGEYEGDGKLGPHCIKGKGDYEMNLYDYVFLISGKYDTFFDKDERLHLKSISHKVDIEVRGKVVYKCENLFIGDEEKSAAAHKYANKNWKDVDKLVRGPIWKEFIDELMKNGNDYLRIVPIEHMFSL